MKKSFRSKYWKFSELQWIFSQPQLSSTPDFHQPLTKTPDFRDFSTKTLHRSPRQHFLPQPSELTWSATFCGPKVRKCLADRAKMFLGITNRERSFLEKSLRSKDFGNVQKNTKKQQKNTFFLKIQAFGDTLVVRGLVGAAKFSKSQISPKPASWTSKLT